MNPLDDFFHALRTGQIERVIAQIATIIALVASLGVLPALGSSGGDGASPPPTTPGSPTTSPNPNPVGSERLVNLERADSSRMATNVPVALNGRVYENSIAARPFINNYSHVEYNLSRTYQTLTATVGIDDNAQIAAQYGLVKFYVDGTLIREVRAELGRPQEVSIPLNKGLRLRIESTSYKPDNTALNGRDGVVIGTPMVRR